MSAVRLFTGVDAVKAADKLRTIRENQERWPYIHVYPPPDSIPVHEITRTAVAAPVGTGSTVEVLAYTVPSGFAFFMLDVVLSFQGASFTWGDGKWSVTRNTPIGVANVQASPVQGLTNIPFPLGSFQSSGPWRLPRAYNFKPLDVVRAAFTDVSVGNGLLAAGFFGWLVPWTETE